MLRIGAGEVGQSHQAEIVIADGIALTGRDAVGAELQAESYVLLHGQPREDAIFLKDDAALGSGTRDGTPVEQHIAGRRPLEARKHAHHRGLAAAGGADHRDEVTIVDVVAYVLDDVEAAPRSFE